MLINPAFAARRYESIIRSVPYRIYDLVGVRVTGEVAAREWLV